MPKALHGVRQGAKRALYVPCDLETFALQVAGGQPSFALKILQNGVGNAVEGLPGWLDHEPKNPWLATAYWSLIKQFSCRLASDAGEVRAAGQPRAIIE